MRTSEILIAAKAKIAKPEQWTQNCLARDDLGASVGYLSSEAFSFCTIGAVASVIAGTRFETYIALSYIQKASGEETMNVTHFNDRKDQTHENVMAVFDRAIRLAIEDHD